MLVKPISSIPDTLWHHFESLGTPSYISSGELLWEPGESRDYECFIVLTGLMRLYHPTRKGTAITLLTISKGGIFGHHPNLQHRPFSTGAEALCDTKLLNLPAPKVTEWLLANDPTGLEFVAWLRKNVNRQLDETYVRLELEHDSAKAKVAHVLLTLDRQALLDRMSRQKIADIANLTVETTVRSITQLIREEVLEGSHFTVLSKNERFNLARLLEAYEPEEALEELIEELN